MVFKKREKSLIILALFFLFIPNLVSAGTVIKDDWFEHDETFVVGNDVYRVFINYNRPSFYDDGIPDQIIFRKNDRNFLILLDECVSHNEFNFCYVDYDYEKKATFGYGGDVFFEFPGINTKIIQPSEGISEYKIDFSSSESGNKFVYDEQEAIITLENTGDLSIYGAELIMEFPNNVTIINRDDFIQVSNMLKKTFNLQKNNVLELGFDYEVTGEGNNKFEYKIVHNRTTIKEGNFVVKGRNPFEITINNPSKFDIREIKDLNVVVKNVHPEKDLTVSSLIVEGPTNFQYLTSHRLFYSARGRYSASQKIIPAGGDRTYSLRYRPLFAGDYSFDFFANFEQENNEFEVEDSKEIEVVSNELSAGLLFSRKKITFGANTELVLTLKNEHSSLSFINIEATVTSDLYNETRQVSRIAPGESVKLFEETVLPLQRVENKKYDAEARVRFSNEAGQSRTITLEDSFEFIGNDSIIRINQKVSNKKVEPGDEIVVEVLVKNLVDNFFGELQVKEVFSQDVEVVTGPVSNSFQFSGNQESRAYLYKIRIPDQVVSDELEIKTIVHIPSIDYEIEKSEIILIDVDVEEILEDPEDIEEEDQEDQEDIEEFEEEKKEGFLRKLLKVIENFFTGLFSRG